MLVYSKVVEGERKLFFSTTGIPTADDAEVTYKKANGAEYTPVAGDTYVDAGSAEGIQKIKSILGSEVVNVYCGDVCIIGEGAAPVTLVSIAVTTLPTKTEYASGETLDTNGMVVTATYSNETTANVTDSCECTPTVIEGTSGDTVAITVAYENKETSFNVTIA